MEMYTKWCNTIDARKVKSSWTLASPGNLCWGCVFLGTEKKIGTSHKYGLFGLLTCLLVARLHFNSCREIVTVNLLIVCRVMAGFFSRLSGCAKSKSLAVHATSTYMLNCRSTSLKMLRNFTCGVDTRKAAHKSFSYSILDRLGFCMQRFRFFLWTCSRWLWEHRVSVVVGYAKTVPV